MHIFHITTIENIIARWRLQGKILISTTDSGANMKKASELLIQRNRPTMQAWQPCSAHLMQTCIGKAIGESPEAEDLLENAAALSSCLRTQAGSRLLSEAQARRGIEEKKRRKAVGFTETRWNSSYLMSKRLIDLADDIINMQEHVKRDGASKEEKRFCKNNKKHFMDQVESCESSLHDYYTLLAY